MTKLEERSVKCFSADTFSISFAPANNVAILDKIYSNLQYWYEKPVVLPNIARSDHKAVLMTPTIVTKLSEGWIL